MTAAQYGRTLTGLSINLIVRDIARSVGFYTAVLGFRALYSDPDFAALVRDDVRLTLHADHAYEAVPWTHRLKGMAKRGAGAEIRILGVDPVAVARAVAQRGDAVLYGPLTKAHGWHEVHVEDPDGYVLAVGVPSND